MYVFPPTLYHSLQIQACCIFALGIGPGGGRGCCRSRSTALDAVEDYDEYLEQSEARDPPQNTVENANRGPERRVSNQRTELQPVGQKGMSAVPSHTVHKPLSGNSQVGIQPPSDQSVPDSSRGDDPQLRVSRLPPALQAGSV
jgi:hypothetical protein